MQKDKIESLLGFAVKAGKLVYGLDNLTDTRKRVYLILTDSSPAENTSKRIRELAAEKGIPLIVSGKRLDTVLYKTNCKAAGLTDRQMAEAVLKNLNMNFQHYVAEVK